MFPTVIWSKIKTLNWAIFSVKSWISTLVSNSSKVDNLNQTFTSLIGSVHGKWATKIPWCHPIYAYLEFYPGKNFLKIFKKFKFSFSQFDSLRMPSEALLPLSSSDKSRLNSMRKKVMAREKSEFENQGKGPFRRCFMAWTLLQWNFESLKADELSHFQPRFLG